MKHYIEKVLEVEDITNKYPEIFDDINEPIYKIKMLTICNGNRDTLEVMWSKSQIEYYINNGITIT